MNNLKKKIYLLLCFVCCALILHAQQAAESAANHDVEANNPLASTKSVNLQVYYMPSLYGEPDVAMTQTFVRYAQPIGRFLFRASLPVVTMSVPNSGPTSELSDLNAFGIYKFKLKKPGIDLGIGPTITFPTGGDQFGSGKWQAGLSAIAFFKTNPVVQMGTLLTWQTSFAGDSDRADVNILTPQIFFMWQLGGGTYLRSTGVWTFNLENDNYNVPIGLGIGKVIKSKVAVFNLFIEPQYSVLARGEGQPQLQFLIGFNTQF